MFLTESQQQSSSVGGNHDRRRRTIFNGGAGDDTVTTLGTSYDEKANQLEALLSRTTIDLWELRELALSEGGLVNDSIRKRAWPALVGLHTAALKDITETLSPKKSSPSQQNQSTSFSRSGPRNRRNNNKDNQKESATGNDNKQDNTQIPTNTLPPYNNDDNPPCNCDHAQIELDVARCTWHLLTGTQRVQKLQMEHKRNKRIAKVIRKKQRRLASCIKRTLDVASASPNKMATIKGNRSPAIVPLRYYQGYHDIACIFLSTLRESHAPRAWTVPASLLSSSSSSASFASLDLPSAVLLQISESHLLDSMQETFQPLQTSLSLTIFPLLALLDREVYEHLMACDMAPFFALPWILTWFSHEIRDTSLVKRLFDAFLASHPAFPLYVCVAMLIHPYNRKQILETECDFSSLHHTLVGLPKNSSAFGWKYRPGQGYVSDNLEEEQDDGDSITSDASHGRSIGSLGTDLGDSQSGLNLSHNTIADDGEMILLQEGLLLENSNNNNNQVSSSNSRRMASETGMAMDGASVTSSSCLSFMQMTNAESSFDENVTKVPFQELLNSAVQYMHRIPPRRIPWLAKRVFGAAYVEELVSPPSVSSSKPKSSFTITSSKLPVMLQDPPSWVVCPSAPSQRWLRSKVREIKGYSSKQTTPTMQRSNFTSGDQSSASPDHSVEPPKEEPSQSTAGGEQTFQEKPQLRYRGKRPTKHSSSKGFSFISSSEPDANQHGSYTSENNFIMARSSSNAARPTDSGDMFRQVPSSDYVKVLRQRQDCTTARLASGMALSIPEEKRKRQKEKVFAVAVSVLIFAFIVLLTFWFPVIFHKNKKDANDSNKKKNAVAEETAYNNSATQEETKQTGNEEEKYKEEKRREEDEAEEEEDDDESFYDMNSLSDTDDSHDSDGNDISDTNEFCTENNGLQEERETARNLGDILPSGADKQPQQRDGDIKATPSLFATTEAQQNDKKKRVEVQNVTSDEEVESTKEKYQQKETVLTHREEASVTPKAKSLDKLSENNGGGNATVSSHDQQLHPFIEDTTCPSKIAIEKTFMY